jgi:Arc/MetJ family transcription regulator
VYHWCMTRTNIDIDDQLVAEAMRRFHLATKKDAVHLALTRLVGEPLDMALFDDVTGIGWDGDLDEMRGPREFHDR